MQVQNTPVLLFLLSFELLRSIFDDVGKGSVDIWDNKMCLSPLFCNGQTRTSFPHKQSSREKSQPVLSEKWRKGCKEDSHKESLVLTSKNITFIEKRNELQTVSPPWLKLFHFCFILLAKNVNVIGFCEQHPGPSHELHSIRSPFYQE